ncbi:MAG: phosphatidylserine decarboxylase [Ruminococcus sp.]|nr:phosphatidylserine decarboxylase [Ruminococcus sp.]
MKYRNRQGEEFEQTTSQDKLLRKMYDSYFCRAVLRFLSIPAFSKIAGLFMDSKLSAGFISDFVQSNDIDLSDYEPQAYKSFNDFFKRKIRPSARPLPKDKNVLISPSDGKVTAYEIDKVNGFVIKNSVYSVSSLLRDKKLAKRYENGYAVIVRLTPDDYHRYCYAATGVKSHDRTIKGVLSTVNPVVNEYVPVYKENSRNYCLIRTEEFGDIIQMEVGALLVGRITNAHPYGRRTVLRGEEKGYFEFGGSTIVLLLEKDKVELCSDLLENTREGFETKLKQGEAVGYKK